MSKKKVKIRFYKHIIGVFNVGGELTHSFETEWNIKKLKDYNVNGIQHYIINTESKDVDCLINKEFNYKQ